ncbi:unnamed protein product [Acanthoscelides obtectus]|uniref:Unconventional myosin-Va n=1 Tax=Acanthoscelides obtectus TaxID=200917 RepID=A0A9P0L757_ACAOB|nr:unnamed protein product [Acanthoscelides obtectus]CAK1656768.1 Unconventional myosin-Va [Acanthoscelides obtectus]
MGTTLKLYTKGAKVWIPHPELVWEGVELLEDYSPSTSKDGLLVLSESGQQKRLPVKQESDLPPLRNPAYLVGENDLTTLSYLHEPAVLHNLQVRFCQQRGVYTYCGIVLVAINPYDELPIYGPDTISSYRCHSKGELDPHIFAVAEEAYAELERARRDQSIIVSGESGAGKTVSAKYAMRYFAAIGGEGQYNDDGGGMPSLAVGGEETQIETKVLASSPIMEAIGNAKTTRNDNSSRFGKFIELRFNNQFHINGASMRTYLLEKSRVVFQAPDERNYHIFYQLCAARDRLKHLSLEHQNNFSYLNQGESPDVTGVNDLEAFEETVNALNMLCFTETEQDDMFKILAAILHLGNISFKKCLVKMDNEQGQEGCKMEETNKYMKKFAELLQIDEEEMRQWLCTRKLVSMRDVFLKPMSVEEAIISRDALAKHIYAELFNWIVLVINKVLESNLPKHKFIGILDIYGFETFETNSFEQFCINYANEKLQQQFNLHVFKLEQEEYIKEGIAWKMIDFCDNQPCIDLIEAKLGILDLLDEECKMPRGTDATWTEKLYSKCAKYPHFSKGRFGSSCFVIDHFADKVQYNSSGFLEKNRDTVMDDQISVIKRSRNHLVKTLFASDAQKLAPPGTKLKISSAKPAPSAQKTHKKTVGSQFRDSLNMLMATLNSTTPHYVRCIKPNDSKSAFDYNPTRVVQQLRACGVLETIRISAAGFPSRWTYADFFYRYRLLCKFKDIDENNIQDTCKKILNQYIKDPDMYQFGKNKIFFRAGQVAYLEKLRTDKQRQCCIMIQKTIRAFIYRRRYMKMKKSAMLIQRYGRGFLARRLAQSIREQRAVITIQRYVRGFLQRKKFHSIHRCIVGIQKYARGYLARIRFLRIKYNAKAIVIQRYIRGYLARERYKAKLRKIIICQAAVRRYLARKQYKRLRVEARSIEHVKKLNKGLENKIISLQQKLDEMNKVNVELKNYQNEVLELKNKMVTFKAMEIEIKNLNNLVVEKNKFIDKLKEEIVQEKEEKIDLIHQLEQYKEEREMWTQETAKLRNELENINEIVRMNEKGAEEKLKIHIKEQKLMMLQEADDSRESYQRLLQEYNQLEQKYEDLKQQVMVNGVNGKPVYLGEDQGYGSTRSTASSGARERLDNITWRVESASASETHSPPSASLTASDVETVAPSESIPPADVGLVLKLQHRLAEVERERERMQRRLDELDSSPRVEEAEAAARISELELVNAQLRSQLIELQNSINEGTGLSKLHEQLVEMRQELDRKTEEIIQLKGVLANQTKNMKTLFSSRSRTGEYINEDGELAQAYETQKTINKQLELELQDEKAKYKAHEKEYKLEIEKLREDNERQQRILSANLTNTPQAQNEAYMHLEITRLTTENLQLTERLDTLNETVRKLKRQIKNLTRKLKDTGVDYDSSVFNPEDEIVANGIGPCIRKKEREYQGMFSYKFGEENVIMKRLVIDLSPRTAIKLLPGLPAYILFMCIRYVDHMNDENAVKSLLSAASSAIKKTVRKRLKDSETVTLWLSNTSQLVNIMKQYSGDAAFQKKNTPKQNEQCLKNFDLTEYRQVFSDIAIWIFQAVVQNVEEKIHHLIVPAVLEHEEIAGMSSGFRRRTASSASEAGTPVATQKPTTALLQELTHFYKILTLYAVSTEAISQIFRQIYYFICASSLNNLLLRKELCNWSKGLQIRHNLSHLEMWIREKQLDETSIQSTLQPIIQAAHLLQARKTDEDVNTVCDMCSALTPLQICKILQLYTPVEYEERVPVSFISKVQQKLKERDIGNNPAAQNLLMDVKYRFATVFNFHSSSICLEDIEIPEVLRLDMLTKI